MSTQCPHGQLARQCLLCEQAAEIERLCNELAGLRDENARLRAVIKMAAKDHWPHGTRAQINAAAKEECDGA